VAAISASSGASLQLSFSAIEVWPWNSSSVGSCNAPGTPEFVSVGPIARTITFLGAFPVMMNPPMATLSPVSTRARLEMLTSEAAGSSAAASIDTAAKMRVNVLMKRISVDSWW
jgi:hypothetical protein